MWSIDLWVKELGILSVAKSHAAILPSSALFLNIQELQQLIYKKQQAPTSLEYVPNTLCLQPELWSLGKPTMAVKKRILLNWK